MSRKLEDLVPDVRDLAEQWLHDCAEVGLDILVTCTLRSDEEQDHLFAIGRTEPGKIVTNARAGESFHQYGVALDFVPMRGGKPVWGTTGDDWHLWEAAGNLAEQHGFEWAARWTGSLRETAHIQYTGRLSISDFKAGKTISSLS